MGNPPLRWQITLLYTVLIAAGTVISLALVPSTRLLGMIAYVATLVATAFPFIWVTTSRRSIHLKRERRVWAFLQFTLLAISFGHILRIAHLIGSTSPLLHPFGEGVTVLGYLAAWIALMVRSGKSVRDRLGRVILAWDNLIILGSSYMIAYQFIPARYLSLGQSWEGAIHLGYPALAIISMLAVTYMLGHSVPRPLHGPRALLVFGIILVACSDIGVVYAYPAYPRLALIVNMLSGIGFLCFGVSSRWETAFYNQRSARSRVIDPFPSVFCLLIPLILGLAALGGTLWNGETTSPTIALQTKTTWMAATIAGLIIIRQIMTFVHHRQLYLHLQQLYTEMAQYASTDPLTNLANHRYFMERLQKEMRRATRYHRPLSLIFCDLDYFKKINDTYGHIAGDRALRAMADCLQCEVRELDIVARYGGEEFVVLLPETTFEQACILAERLCTAVANLTVPQKHGDPIRLTMSCGISAYPDSCDSVESLLASADDAMYRAKHDGRNRVVRALPRPRPQFVRQLGGVS